MILFLISFTPGLQICHFLFFSFQEHQNTTKSICSTHDDSSSQKQKSSFIKCDICHAVCKNIKELGAHRYEVHAGVYKPKLKQVIPPSTPPAATPSKSLKQPTVSPQVDDGSSVFGHIQAEHPQYIFFCNCTACYRSFITRSGLYKHKKQVHSKEQGKLILKLKSMQLAVWFGIYIQRSLQ